MTLSPDERAILALVLVHRLDYEAIAATAGTDTHDARARARKALAELGGAALRPDVADLLLGRVCADARRRALELLRRDRTANEGARRIDAALEAEFPEARPEAIVPPLDGAGPARSVAASGSAQTVPRPFASLRGRWRPMARAAFALSALCVALIALALTGVLSGGDPGTTGGGGADSGAGLAGAVGGDGESFAGGAKAVRIPLRGAGAGGGSGSALITLNAAYKPFLELRLRGLAPAPSGMIHVLWLDNGKGRGLPLPATIALSRTGSFGRRFALAPELLPLLDLARSLELVLVSKGELSRLSRQVGTGASAASGAKAQRDLPRRPGRVVLRGAIPRS